MKNTNRPLTKPTIKQVLFSTPIEDFVDSIDIPAKRTSKPRTKPVIRDDDPMLPPEHYDLIQTRMKMIDRVAPEQEMLSEEDLRRYHRLKEKVHQTRKPVKSISVGSSGAGNIFALDTRGASKAVDEFANKKRRADRDQMLLETAPELEELEEKKREAKRRSELRNDMIEEVPEAIEERRELEDDENQRYYRAGLRYISQGEFDKAADFLNKAGLSTADIDQELNRGEKEHASTDNEVQGEGNDMEEVNGGSKKRISEPDSGPAEDSAPAGEELEESFQKGTGQWSISPPSEEEINNAISRGLTDRDTLFSVQRALANSIAGSETEDEETRDELLKRLNSVNRSMLLNDGVPESEVDQLAEDYTQTLINHKQAEHIEENENTSFKDLIMFWPKVANKFLKVAQHPIMGKNLQSLSEFYHNTDLDNDASWKELHNRWIKNNQDFIEDMTDQASDDPEEKMNIESEEDSSSVEPVDAAELDTIESAVDELEKEADSDQKESLDNIRMEIQDMRSSGKI